MSRPLTNPGLGYLPRGIKVGDRLRLVPSALAKQGNGSEAAKPRPMDGMVVYIHPLHRFATVEFRARNHEMAGHWVDAGWRENWPIMPPERRLAHEDPKPPKADVPLTVRLQQKDWSGKTSVQIAEELDVTARSVTGAINNLSKRGIIIPYKKIVPGRPKKGERHEK